MATGHASRMRRALETTGWGLYLASSWTWCIGMFLPILLLRWWGWPGFFAFAIPNVLGCMLFGYVLTPQTSRMWCERFAKPMRWFAWATIAFQAWFLVWATTGIPTASGLASVVPIIAFVFLFFPGGKRFWIGAGSLAFLASMVLFAVNGMGSLAVEAPAGSLSMASLAFAAPCISFGFLLCPYLDPTFHRALQQSPSRHSFAVFGIAFLLQLLFAASTFDNRIGGPHVTSAIWMQWMMQTGFTMCALVAVTGPIARSVWASAPVDPMDLLMKASMTRRMVWLVGVPAMAAVLGPILLQVMTIATKANPILMPAADLLHNGDVTDWSAGEATYLRWLGLFGVVFPGWLALRLRGRSTATTWGTLLFAAALADQGMVGARTYLLLISCGVILIVAFLPSQPRNETNEIVPADSR